MEVVTRIAVGLVWHGELLLVGRRSEEDVLGGFDEFPGGKCRPNERPELAVVRECREETGLAVIVKNIRLVADYEYPHGRVELHFFDCTLAASTVDPPPLPPPFHWVSVRRLDELRFPPANNSVLAALRRTGAR